MKLAFPCPLLITLVLFVLVMGLSLVFPEEHIKGWVEAGGSYGPILLIFVTLVSCVFAPISGSPMLYLGYLLFGEKTVWYSAIAGWLSYSVNFAIARKWGRPMVLKLVGVEPMKKVDEFTTAYGFGVLLLLRVFAGGVHDFISYAMGLTAIPYRTYIGISTIGAIPGTVLWYYLARNIQNPLYFIATTWIMIWILSGGVLVYWKLKKGKRDNVKS